MADEIVRAILRSRGVRVVVALTTDVAREAARRHQAGREGAVALARAATSALLLATLTKSDEERVTLQILGGGPLGGVAADARSSGDVRVYASTPGASAPWPDGQRPSVSQAVGWRGTLNVVRDMGLKDRYQGTSQVITGEIDEDVEHYLRVSEQIDSALGCDVVLADGEASVTAAAGMLVQALPESAGAALIRESQHALRTGALWRALASGERDAAGLVRAVVGAGEADELELLERRPARFACQCSATRVNEMLALLDHGDLESMIAQGQPAEVTCNFCKNKYSVSIDEMRAISSMQVPRAKA